MFSIGKIKSEEVIFFENAILTGKALYNLSLIKIHSYQKNAAINKKFSCQTRLLGLEANLIKVMNSNFKRKEVKNIIDAIKKYC